MSTAIIYARVSSARQADDGLPIGSQIDQAKVKVTSLGATLLRIFKDEGISGRTDKRPAFQEAIGFCASHEVDFFICWNTSRFARNKLDAAAYKKLLRSGGTRVVYATSDLDSSTDEGWFSESIHEIVDEHHSRTIGRDTQRSMMKNARDGYFTGGRLPLGYESVPEGKRRRLIVVENEAQLVRELFQMYLAGAGCKEIAMRLNREGRTKRGARWSKNSVTLVLKNERYVGLTVFGRRNHAENYWRPEADWIRTASHAAIISKEDFMKVQHLFKARSPNESNGSPLSQHTFTGMLKCGSCGSSMKIETATGRSRMYSYYNCSASLAGKNCSSRRVDADKLDAYLIEKILDSLLTPARIEDLTREVHEIAGSWIQERKAQRESIVKQIRNAESRRDNLFSILEHHGRDAPNLADLTVRLRGLRDEIDGLETKLVEVEQAPDFEVMDVDVVQVSEFLRDLILSKSEPAERRLFFADFIDNIVLQDDQVKVNYKPHRLVNPRGFDVVHSADRWLPVQCALRTAVWALPAKLRLAA